MNRITRFLGSDASREEELSLDGGVVSTIETQSAWGTIWVVESTRSSHEPSLPDRDLAAVTRWARENLDAGAEVNCKRMRGAAQLFDWRIVVAARVPQEADRLAIQDELQAQVEGGNAYVALVARAE